MSQALIEALNAVAPAASARILDGTDGRYPRTLVGILLADAALSQRSAKFSVPVEEGKETDYKIRFDLESLQTSGLSRKNATWSGTLIQPQTMTHPVEGRFQQSGYGDSLVLFKNEVERLTMQGLPFSGIVEMQVDKIVSSIHKALQEDLLGSDAGRNSDRSGYVTPDQTIWGANDRRLGNIAYPLQGGYTGNATTGTGTYYYGDNFDLNTIPQVKAVTAGDTTTGFGVPTPTNWRTKIIQPLEDADKGNPNPDRTLYTFVDSTIYDYLMQFVEDQVQVTQWEGSAMFGYRDIAEFVGMRFIREPYLDTLYTSGGKRCSISIDPSTWILRHKDLKKILKFSGDEIPDRQLIHTLWRWDFSMQLLCEQPWRNAYGFGLTTSG